jgi:hypothetical protein
MLTQAELEKIHADIVRLRAETMQLVGPATRTSKRANSPARPSGIRSPSPVACSPPWRVSPCE